MVQENLQSQKPNYELMNYRQLEADPVAGPILQGKALEYLRTKDKEYFERQFTGAMDSGGYLVPKGSAGLGSVRPSQTIGDAGLQEVAKNTKIELAGKFKEQIANTSSTSPEVSKESTTDKKLKFDIIQATDWRSLWQAIDDNGGLQGSEKKYSSAELNSLVSRVANGENPLLLTGAFGFRQKVLDLIKIDQLKAGLK